jgi:endoglycosylceramidase
MSIRGSGPWPRSAILATTLGLAACGASNVPTVEPLAGQGEASCQAPAPGPSQLRQEGRFMVDGQNRVVLLHGVNAVWKLKPYFPPATAEGFTAADADWLRDHGFNTVRLGVIFAGVMPQEGFIDTAYLASVDRVVQLLASRGIYVMFDFHQDMYNEKFGGEGFPDWAVYDDGVPATNIGFPQTYFTPAVGRAFDNFWQNKNGLWDRYADAWAAVAAKWRDQDRHMGFDLMNEPYPGSHFATCANPAGCPVFDTQYLQKMQERALAGIRAVDPGNIVWFEPNFVFNGGAATHLGTLDFPDDPNLGFSWHKYCLLGVVLHSQGQDDLPACEQWHQVVSEEAELVIERLHSTTLVTEFGASDDLPDIEDVMRQTERKFVGWQYWQYKNWRDPTTESQESGGQGLFADDEDFATVKTDKLKVLERPYPRATAGVPVALPAGEDPTGFRKYALDFDPATRVFTYRYTPRCAGGPTEIYVPKLHYPDGYALEVSGARAISPPNATLLKLEADKDATEVSVRITPAS